MTKINMEDRVHITRHMMQDVHCKKMQEAAKEYRKASIVAYKAYYTKELARMNRLPEGWLPTKRSVSVQFNGMRMNMDFNLSGCVRVNLPGKFNSLSVNNIKTGAKQPEDVYKRILTCDDNYKSFRVNEGHHAFEAFEALSVACSKFDEAKAALTADAHKVFTVLKSMTTAESVVKKWPEAAPYVAKAVVGDKKSTALAPNFSDLNTRLGLPVA